MSYKGALKMTLNWREINCITILSFPNGPKSLLPRTVTRAHLCSPWRTDGIRKQDLQLTVTLNMYI